MFDADSSDDPDAVLDRFADNLPGLVYRCEPAPPWALTVIRGEVEALTGYAAATFEDGEVTFADIISEGDLDALTSELAASLDDGSQFSTTYDIVTRSGATRHVFERGNPVTDETGDVIALEGIVLDITRRKRNEERLERQNDLFAHTQELADVGGWEFDLEADELRWTEQVRRIHGVPPDFDPSVEDAIEFYHPDDRDRIAAAVERAIDEGEPYDLELRIVTGEDEQRWVRTRGTPEIVDGAVVTLRGAVQDVTDRRERRRFEAVFNNTYQFTGLVATDGTILEVNDAGLTYTGTGHEDPVGAKLWDALAFAEAADRESVRRGYERVLDGGSYTDEIHLLGTEGRAVIDFSIRPVTDEDGEIDFLVPEGRDITESKERERLFRVLNRLLRHNIRNDLTVIRGYANTLIETLSAGKPTEQAERVDDAAENLLTTTEKAKQMIDLILHPPADTDAVDLGAVATTVADRYRDRYPDATIDVSIDDRVMAACTDRVTIAVAQLVENGLEHNSAPDSRVEISVSNCDGMAALSVTDNGVGIAPDEWSMVSEEVRNEQTQLRHGSGMGLLLAQWLADEFDGQLEYTIDEVNGGTELDGSVVTLRLPTV